MPSLGDLSVARQPGVPAPGDLSATRPDVREELPSAVSVPAGDLSPTWQRVRNQAPGRASRPPPASWASTAGRPAAGGDCRTRRLAYCPCVTEAHRPPPRRRRWWRRSALPRSRPALAFGALVAATIVVLLLLGLTRARPGRQVPEYDPTPTSTTTTGPRPLPSITIAVTVPAPTTTTTTVKPRRNTTTTRSR